MRSLLRYLVKEGNLEKGLEIIEKASENRHIDSMIVCMAMAFARKGDFIKARLTANYASPAYRKLIAANIGCIF